MDGSGCVVFISVVKTHDDSTENLHHAVKLCVTHINISHVVSLEPINCIYLDKWDYERLSGLNASNYYPFTIPIDNFRESHGWHKGYEIPGCKIFMADRIIISPEPIQHFMDRCETERLNRMTALATKVKEAHPDLDSKTIEYLARTLEI